MSVYDSMICKCGWTGDIWDCVPIPGDDYGNSCCPACGSMDVEDQDTMPQKTMRVYLACVGAANAGGSNSMAVLLITETDTEAKASAQSVIEESFPRAVGWRDHSTIIEEVPDVTLARIAEIARDRGLVPQATI